MISDRVEITVFLDLNRSNILVMSKAWANGEGGELTVKMILDLVHRCSENKQHTPRVLAWGVKVRSQFPISL